MFEVIICFVGEIFFEVIFVVYFDYGDEVICYDCIDFGFFSFVMIDVLYELFDENIVILKCVVDWVYVKGIFVEVEFGMFGGVEEDIKVEDGYVMFINFKEVE